jgi:hypothetical protein
LHGPRRAEGVFDFDTKTTKHTKTTKAPHPLRRPP